MTAPGFVLDSSMALCWVLPDESSEVADRALGRFAAEFALVPPLWFLEIANGLRSSLARQRIGTPEVEAATTLLTDLDIRADALNPPVDVLAIEAHRAGLSAYDASYLLLARDRGLPLATLDRRLAAAATQEGVPLVA